MDKLRPRQDKLRFLLDTLKLLDSKLKSLNLDRENLDLYETILYIIESLRAFNENEQLEFNHYIKRLREDVMWRINFIGNFHVEIHDDIMDLSNDYTTRSIPSSIIDKL
jgi:hypothetical protein